MDTKQVKNCENCYFMLSPADAAPCQVCLQWRHTLPHWQTDEISNASIPPTSKNLTNCSACNFAIWFPTADPCPEHAVEETCSECVLARFQTGDRYCHTCSVEYINATREILDDIVHPSHYATMVIEPVDFTMQNNLPFFAGNIIKYTCRAGKKLYDGMDAVQSEITDLKKVQQYAALRIKQLETESSPITEPTDFNA